MNVSLTPELERLVQEKVASGMYSSANEVIRESLRLLRDRDELQREKIESLRNEIAIGIEQGEVYAGMVEMWLRDSARPIR